MPGVNCKEYSKEELLISLKMTLEELLDLNREDAIGFAGKNYQEELVCV